MQSRDNLTAPAVSTTFHQAYEITKQQTWEQICELPYIHLFIPDLDVNKQNVQTADIADVVKQLSAFRNVLLEGAIHYWNSDGIQEEGPHQHSSATGLSFNDVKQLYDLVFRLVNMGIVETHFPHINQNPHPSITAGGLFPPIVNTSPERHFIDGHLLLPPKPIGTPWHKYVMGTETTLGAVVALLLILVSLIGSILNPAVFVPVLIMVVAVCLICMCIGKIRQYLHWKSQHGPMIEKIHHIYHHFHPIEA